MRQGTFRFKFLDRVRVRPITGSGDSSAHIEMVGKTGIIGSRGIGEHSKRPLYTVVFDNKTGCFFEDELESAA